ncbi:L-2-hydroxycarboxylate dehydrogenase (NAD+) [Methanobrevibacter olleyae]|uniref:L-2-hydroxycarboxylate dehydrogenase (NAD+) n=1 Tax=Methanobrevibacter olleyae TaxID=294671 RepID=A0A1I4FF95_METOL|nr:L-sulfolactate dehydrogenase [Methanobrevibacter olleyae]SFL16655.1 L-2-hydroxycarboxylate dehydrogenase (NAD+) [Methanobrevibacter olleyae]
MKISVEKERELVNEILIKIGVKEEHAKIIADATLDSDLKGFTSHGLGRFPQYIRGINKGFIETEGEFEIVKETDSVALIDGKNLFGQYVAHEAMSLAIKKAKESGIGAVGAFNSNHFGVTGYYSDLAIRNDMIGIVICNTDPGVAPLGGKKAILGTNPIAIGIPSETYIAVDMATSVSARGKLLEAKRKGEEIPPDTAIDKDGKPTTNPEAALEGTILPFGGVKGYALSFMIEIMCGPLVNAAFGTKVTGTAGDYKEDCNKGDLFIAINPEQFVSIDKFKEEVEEFVKEVRESGNTFVPGDLEVKRIAENEKNGLPIDEKLYETLKEICDNLEIDLDSYLTD